MNRFPWKGGSTQIVVALSIVLLCLCIASVSAGLVAWTSLFPPVYPTVVAVASPTQLPHVSPTVVQPILPLPTPSRASIVAPLVTSTATARPLPQHTVAPTTLPSPTVGMPPGRTQGTEQLLLSSELPQRDIRLLAQRLKRTGPIPQVVHITPPVYRLEDEAQFWVGNMDSKEHAQISAVLRYVTPHLYVWVEKGIRYDQERLGLSAETFESRIYPTTRAFFGGEWSPGVDSDPRLHILHSTAARMGDSVAGYYSSADEYSRLANPFSNEREMFYVSLTGLMSPGTDFYDGVLAHEFQHMIHWAIDRNEDTWVNEGFSELAAYLNGYDPGGFEWAYLADPDVQLTTWEESDASVPHYGASYLFMAYLLGRLGEEPLKRVVANPANGSAGFDAVLSEYHLRFEDVFADWLVANYLDNVAWANAEFGNRYTYPDHVVGPVSLDTTHETYPVQGEGTVHQYGADYVGLQGSGDLAIEFRGVTEARLVPAAAHSGRYAWWSNRGDYSDTTLTRAFSLGAVRQATLRVWMWYDIEEDWDHAYVEVSADGGQTWDILAGPSTTTRNPNGNSFGPAYTGRSGEWVEQTFDLTPYAGRGVLVRFEYVTDDVVNRAGLLIDDVRIPELGYADDLEAGPGGWEAKGFVYSDNLVSQRYLVQLIAFGRQTTVQRVVMDDSQRGRIELRGLGDEVESAVLVISALAPVTTEVAPYEYEVSLSRATGVH